MADYKPDPSGLKVIGNSAKMGQATLNVARQIASTAGQVGHSEYDARSMTVVSGRMNEQRAGAVTYEAVRDHRDVRNRVLVEIAQRMNNRGSR